MNAYYNPVPAIQGKGSTAKIPQLVKEILPEGGSVLLLAWGSPVFSMEPFQTLMDQNEYCVIPMCFQASNPTVEQLYEIFEKTRTAAPKLVIAVGGGSVMDVGKSLCCLYGKPIASANDLRKRIIEKDYGKPLSKWIGVPTTAGTGSEVTCWATIWDPKENAKRSVESKENYACLAVVDPDLSEGMPVSLAVSSALDAAAHAAESFWAKHTNMTSRALALEAVRIIMSRIDDLAAGDKSACEAMSQGSLLAGMAFSNTKTTACHSISYPLTMHCGIPHGTAVSLLLGPVFRINQEKTEGAERLLAAFHVADGYELEERIRGILAKAGIPSSLKDWNVKREKLPYLASQGITKGRADNNPAELNVEMIEKILERIYESERGEN